MTHALSPMGFATREYGTDVEVDVDLDMDACCTMRSASTQESLCDAPVEWLVVLGCCGHRKLVCDDHRHPVVSVLPKMFTCSRCGTARPTVLASHKV